MTDSTVLCVNWSSQGRARQHLLKIIGNCPETKLVNYNEISRSIQRGACAKQRTWMLHESIDGMILDSVAAVRC